ncbi:hypothetical protein [Schlesneria paludicola]|uniref:hypothetical protein n=1 Tax=Schlesneria paludicola TaxID=360056 RepID=UPI000299E737|nr:hypothetical protein [Schlesneria paludicola]
MSLSLDLSAALTPLSGQAFVPPKTVAVSDTSGTSLAIDVIAVESLGVSCEELRLEIASLGAATLDTLKKWANDLCRRVTYLLENLGPLEIDAQGNQILIRSTPPDKSAGGTTKYYEVMLSSLGAGRFSLRRFRYDTTSGQRVAVPLQLTHEQLAKLVNDLVATVPSSP